MADPNESHELGFHTKASDGTHDSKKGQIAVDDKTIIKKDSQAPHDTKANELGVTFDKANPERQLTKKKKKRHRKGRRIQEKNEDEKEPPRAALVEPKNSERRPSTTSSRALPSTISSTTSSTKSVDVNTGASTGTSGGRRVSIVPHLEGQSMMSSIRAPTTGMVRTEFTLKIFAHLRARYERSFLAGVLTIQL